MTATAHRLPEPEPQLRLLIVDDSVVARQLVTKALAELPDMEVVGVAADGEQALRSIAARLPDLVVLDLEMPGLDGLETLARLRQRWPELPVVVFSALTERGARRTVEALQLGADDYLLKPRGLPTPTAALAYVREELGGRIRMLAGSRAHSYESDPTIELSQVRTGPGASSAIELVVIAASTGGPAALAELIPALPGDLDVPVAVVQHLLPDFLPSLAARLDERSNLKISPAFEGATLRPGELWFAPGGIHLRVDRREDQLIARLERSPRRNGCRPAADLLFESAAQVCGGGVLGIVLTGMGNDGCAGARAIVGAGGRVLVQDERSSVVWSMPGAVARAGLAEQICTLSTLAERIVDAIRTSAHG